MPVYRHLYPLDISRVLDNSYNLVYDKCYPAYVPAAMHELKPGSNLYGQCYVYNLIPITNLFPDDNISDEIKNKYLYAEYMEDTIGAWSEVHQAHYEPDLDEIFIIHD